MHGTLGLYMNIKNMNRISATLRQQELLDKFMDNGHNLFLLLIIKYEIFHPLKNSRQI